MPAKRPSGTDKYYQYVGLKAFDRFLDKYARHRVETMNRIRALEALVTTDTEEE